MSSSTRKCEESAACAHAQYIEGIFHVCREVYYGDAKFVITITRLHKSNVCVEHVNYKRSKNNGEVYKLRKTFAVFHLVPLCFLEEELIG